MMLSGYLVLGKPKSLRENAQRTWQRIGLPLVVFYVIVQAYTALAAYLREEPFELASIFHNLSKNTYTYLYFLVVLVFLYLLVPFFRQVFESREKGLAKYVIIFFFANAALATLARYTSLRVGDVLHTYTMWIVWAGYFLYGYYMKLHESEVAKRWRLNMFLLVAGYFATVVLGYFSLQQHLIGNDIFYIGGQTYPEEYLSISVIMMSLGAFNLLMTWKVPHQLRVNPLFLNTVKFFTAISFGVYLVHPIVMDVLNKFMGVTADSSLMPNLPMYVVINALITLVVSTLLSTLLTYTPVLRKAVGRS
jgi:surface polysaccharide O-acyltransferase-like enzyme